MVKRKCLICKKEFWRMKSKTKNGFGRFCSKKCFGIWFSKHKRGKNHPSFKREKVKRVCKTCSKTFNVAISPSDIKRGGGKFCSRKCKGIWHSIHESGKNSPNWKPKIRRICKICGKEFWLYPSLIKGNKGNFCSHRCFGLWIATHSKQKDTSIEQIIEKELKKRSIKYRKHISLLGLTIPDFVLSNRMVIYCDGNYWHNLPGRKDRDLNQTFILEFNGYNVFRFTETEIKKSAKRCVNKVVKYIEGGFMDDEKEDLDEILANLSAQLKEWERKDREREEKRGRRKKKGGEKNG